MKLIYEYFLLNFLSVVDSYESTSRVYESSYRPPTSLSKLSSLITLLPTLFSLRLEKGPSVPMILLQLL